MGYDYLPNLIHINDEFNFLINIYIYIYSFLREVGTKSMLEFKIMILIAYPINH
jgi:hypothetical protein